MTNEDEKTESVASSFFEKFTLEIDEEELKMILSSTQIGIVLFDEIIRSTLKKEKLDAVLRDRINTVLLTTQLGIVLFNEIFESIINEEKLDELIRDRINTIVSRAFKETLAFLYSKNRPIPNPSCEILSD
jgi:signal recognition particle GTPase